MKLSKLKHLFTRKRLISKWQTYLFGSLMFTVGIIFSIALLSGYIKLPKIFATTSWTQTDWSGGVGSSTSNQYVSGSQVDTESSGQVTLEKSEFFVNGSVDSSSELSSWTGIEPSSISGLALHLKADTGVKTASDCLTDQTTGGGLVGCWTDQSGNGRNVIQSNSTYEPIYSVSGPNGHKAINFLGDYLNGNNAFAIHQTYTVFKSPNAVFNNYGTPIGVVNYGEGRPYIFENNQAYFHSNPLPSAVWKDSVVVSSAGQYVFSPITNWMIMTANTAYPTNLRTYQIGASESSYTAHLHIAEILGYGRVLSDSERTSIENHLNLKYKTTYSVSVDTGIKHTGAGSARIAAPVARAIDFTQYINLGSTDTHKLSVLAYTTGVAVTSADAVLQSAGANISTTYTSVGDGWYEMNAIVTGSASSTTYGVQVKSGKTVYIDDLSIYKYAVAGSVRSNVFDTAQASAWNTLSYSVDTPTNTSVVVKIKTSNDPNPMDFASCNGLVSGLDLSTSEQPASNCVTEGHRYVQYEVSLISTSTTATPNLNDITINFQLADDVHPTTNATSPRMWTVPDGREILEDQWNNSVTPYFSWTEGADNPGGIGLLGYCAYLGNSPGSSPLTQKGILGDSPVGIPPGSTCGFIVPSNELDTSTATYLSTALVSDTEYYLTLLAIDIAGNVYEGDPAAFHFLHDITAPTNVAYISTPSVNFSNVVDMNFSWPITGSAMAIDNESQIIGWQYQLNGTAGPWKGVTHSDRLNMDIIPLTEGSYILTQIQDGADISQGSNIVYFRTVDNAGNISSPTTYRTGSLNYGGAAPAFSTGCDDTMGVVLTPSSSDSNSFALSWLEATPAGDNEIGSYYYMINTSPPNTYATLVANGSTYISNATATSVTSHSLPNVNKGTNTVYVVAVDTAETPNYSPSNCIKGVFTLNSSDPDNPGNLVASDSSIKSQSQWNVTLSWTAPVYQGAGNLTYLVYRSDDGTTYSSVGSTTGLSYVDNAPLSQTYYYKLYSKDGADAQSSGSNSVFIKPTGKYTSAPSLESGPSLSGITTRKATISWSTNRSADSKVAYGTASGSYLAEEPSNSTQVTSHTINLTNLSPGTTYYYKTKWTDEDGNTGISEEKSFKTEDAPTVVDPKVLSAGLDTVTLSFTSKGSSKVKVYYGTTTSFGGTKEFSTSTSETVYTTTIDGLQDGTKYFYKINSFDSEGSEYEGNTLTFETLPRPKITNVRFQEVTGTAQPAIIVSWDTNTETSSIITYYPQGRPQLSRDEISVSLVKGPHKMLLKNLNPQTIYEGQVKGKDKAGNEATSDTQSFTTSTDTRPPQVMNLRIEGSSDIQGSSSSGSVEDAKSQLVVSWDTDEPATSQVEFGEGTGTTYNQKTQEDTNLTTNHVIIISNLTPSKVYHLRTLSKDKAQNTGQSVDTVTITPKSSRSALELVIGNLYDVFGILSR